MPKPDVLVVDDDLEVLKFYRKIFSASSAHELDILGSGLGGGFGVAAGCLAYSDPTALVADYRKMVEGGKHLPLCIVDMRMPQQNGLTTAEQLREIDPEIEIVISTAAGDFTAEEIRRRLGERVFFVHKPFNAGEFALMVQALIDSWEDRRELRQQTAFLTSLLEASHDLIFMKGKDGVYLTCNKRFAEFAKCERQKIIGGTDYDFLPPEVCAAFREQDRQVIDSGSSFTYRETVEHPDGGPCLLETIKSPVLSDQGEILGILGVARDISRRGGDDAEVTI